ncbi:MAG: hypothetical protein HY897_18190 [Deltaproteobacteria bacterium]|nr:hypothetical protein [Deltaproteobacteria bacterium]
MADVGTPADVGSTGTVSVPHAEGCNDLIPEVCIYPYPSMVHMREYEGSATGWRVSLARQTLPFPEESPGALDFFIARFNEADGFSISTPLLAIFPSAHVDETTLPRVDDLASSITAASAVQVFDRETGARVPVWAEMDNYAREKSSGKWLHKKRTMMIRPQAALAWNRRHAVVVTDAAKDADGLPLPRARAMEALVLGRETDNAQIETLRPDYEALFAFLEENGVTRASVVLAWEFHTMSREFSEAPLRALVEEGRKRIGTTFAFTRSCETTDPDTAAAAECGEDLSLNEHVWRRLEGKFSVPTFVGGDGFVEWADGTPVPKGEESVYFVAVVPKSVRDGAPGAAPVLQIGHGLMSSQSRYLPEKDDENGVLALADKMGAIAIGADFKALCTADLGVPLDMIRDGSRMWALRDQVMQGVVTYNLIVPFVLASLKDDPALAAAGGGSVIDPSRTYYYGLSLGGMAGAVHAALSPEIKSAVYNVPSAMFSSLLQHSSEFLPFQQFMEMYHPNPVHQQILLALVQRALDPIDPINWRERFFDEPLTPLGRKNMLWQIAKNDCNAPDFGAYALERSTSIPLVLPTTHEVFGVSSTIEAPTAPGSSGFVIYDTGKAAPTYSNADVPDNGAHFSLRCNDEVHRQVADFFSRDAEGTIVLHCGGGACFIDGIECRTGAAK